MKLKEGYRRVRSEMGRRSQAGNVVVWAIVGLLLGGGLAAAAYFMLNDESDPGPAVTAETPTPTPSPEDTTVQEFPSERPSPPAAEELFDPSMIEERIVLSGGGTKTLSVHFVSPEIGNAPLIAVQTCTEALAKPRFASVSCYGYHSEEALEAAGVDIDTGELENLCWTSFLSRRQDGTGQGQHVNPAYDENVCGPAAERSS